MRFIIKINYVLSMVTALYATFGLIGLIMLLSLSGWPWYITMPIAFFAAPRAVSMGVKTVLMPCGNGRCSRPAKGFYSYCRTCDYKSRMNIE